MFSSERVAQIAAEFVQRAGGPLSALKLVNLIYLTDRLSMERYGEPITYDRLVSTDHGPAPWRTLGFVNGHDSEAWDRWLAGCENHQVSLARTGFEREDLDQLSDADMEIIDKAWEKFGGMGQWEISQYMREYCPEWEDPNGSLLPMQEEKIFQALGWDVEKARQAQEEIESQRHLDTLFSGEASELEWEGKSDVVVTREWRHLASERGDARAQYLLGLMYEKGEGVEKDADEAMKWFRKAAELGYAEAQSNQDGTYREGKPIRKSRHKSAG